MAVSYTCKDFDAYVISKKEAAHVIAFLSAQLAETAVRGHQAGAAPDFVVHDPNGGNGRRVVLSVRPDVDQLPEPSPET